MGGALEKEEEAAAGRLGGADPRETAPAADALAGAQRREDGQSRVGILSRKEGPTGWRPRGAPTLHWA